MVVYFLPNVRAGFSPAPVNPIESKWDKVTCNQKYCWIKRNFKMTKIPERAYGETNRQWDGTFHVISTAVATSINYQNQDEGDHRLNNHSLISLDLFKVPVLSKWMSWHVKMAWKVECKCRTPVCNPLAPKWFCGQSAASGTTACVQQHQIITYLYLIRNGRKRKRLKHSHLENNDDITNCVFLSFQPK